MRGADATRGSPPGVRCHLIRIFVVPARPRSAHPTLLALVVALGGFLMGFDTAVISGAIDPISGAFTLDAEQTGWAVSCLTLGATVAMALAGKLADRIGRRSVLMLTAALFTGSAIGCALADEFWILVVARIIGGFGVGGALLIAPVYIAEIAPAERRGQLVSFNQLNIVLGISAAFFSNYFLGEAGLSWRWMLGVEAIPAALYFLALPAVPRSPRWLAAQGRLEEARDVLARIHGAAAADAALNEVRAGLASDAARPAARVGELLDRRMRRVMVVGLGLGFFQQITGINAIFYYSTTIFSMAGLERDTALWHAVVVGLVNVVFTLYAMWLIDRVGRRPLLLVGTAVMTLALLASGAAFASATYAVTPAAVATTTKKLSADAASALRALEGQTYDSQLALAAAVRDRPASLDADAATALSGAIEALAKNSLQLDEWVVLVAILAYIAAFAISLGPVMWAMFSEIFPQRLRGLAISAAGFFNSAVSFTVVQLFPTGIDRLGPAVVYFVFAGFAAMAFAFSLWVVPETKGKSLEELEAQLIGAGEA